ncbi:SsrA-binding protein [endosymbiont of Pachyrhynchus infernalis]|uniref:SsrA-binding protein n=1 Tax=endosymbiont of Pachyrhynchus infernalis TaxID=1971488 RepID=UPI000DC6DD00|nr:SsrA-binding protein [endosymbiont of Pachyrhynchus infernalis]BBA84780.1 ssrA-binding protein [endosymbiont of Pachyrhynchus infernalis]
MNIIHINNNKNSFYKYNIEDKMDIGLVLKGYEVKCIKNNKANFDKSYINIIKNEFFLLGSIFTIKDKNINSYNRKIKLLLNKKEILILLNKINSKNFIIKPISIFLSKTLYIKIKVGISKKIKKIDKRLYIKNKNSNFNINKYKS